MNKGLGERFHTKITLGPGLLICGSSFHSFQTAWVDAHRCANNPEIKDIILINEGTRIVQLIKGDLAPFIACLNAQVNGWIVGEVYPPQPNNKDSEIMHTGMKELLKLACETKEHSSGLLALIVLYKMLVASEQLNKDFTIEQACTLLDEFNDEVINIRAGGVNALPLSFQDVWTQGKQASLAFSAVCLLIEYHRKYSGHSFSAQEMYEQGLYYALLWASEASLKFIKKSRKIAQT